MKRPGRGETDPAGAPGRGASGRSSAVRGASRSRRGPGPIWWISSRIFFPWRYSVRTQPELGNPEEVRARILSLLSRAEEQGRELGYDTLQVDEARFAVVALLDEVDPEFHLGRAGSLAGESPAARALPDQRGRGGVLHPPGPAPRPTRRRTIPPWRSFTPASPSASKGSTSFWGRSGCRRSSARSREASRGRAGRPGPSGTGLEETRRRGGVGRRASAGVGDGREPSPGRCSCSSSSLPWPRAPRRAASPRPFANSMSGSPAD